MLLLNHVGLATKDAAALTALLNDLTGAPVSPAEDVAGQGVRVRFVDTGQAKLELLESLDRDSPIGRHIDKYGEGLHHIAFSVSDIDHQFRRLMEAGFTPLSVEPGPGAGGKRIFFLHPKNTGRVLIEFCQPVEQHQVSIYGQAPELEESLQRTGYSAVTASPGAHLIAARCTTVPHSLVNTCRTLTLFHPDGPVGLPADFSGPVLLCMADSSADLAISLKKHWPKAHLAMLPAVTPANVWATVITQFWARNA